MENEVTQGSNGQNNNAIGQGGGICNIKVNTDNLEYKERHQSIDLRDTIEYWKEAFNASINFKNEVEKDIEDLKQTIKDFKIGMEHDKRKHPIKAECETKHQFAFRVEGESVVRCQECYKCLNDEQYFTSLEEENKWLKKINKDFENKSYELWIKNKNLENLADENKTLKFQLQELHQANVNLFNKNEKLKKELKELERKNKYISNEEIVRLNDVIRQYEHKDKNRTEIHSLSINCDSLENKIRLLNEQLELKEIINQDLVKKYQLLQEEIDAYDINMLELVEKHSKLENDYKELQDKYNSLQEYAKNSSNNLFKVNLQHKVKPYLSEGVINVIVESNKEFKQ